MSFYYLVSQVISVSFIQFFLGFMTNASLFLCTWSGPRSRDDLDSKTFYMFQKVQIKCKTNTNDILPLKLKKKIKIPKFISQLNFLLLAFGWRGGKRSEWVISSWETMRPYLLRDNERFYLTLLREKNFAVSVLSLVSLGVLFVLFSFY